MRYQIMKLEVALVYETFTRSVCTACHWKEGISTKNMYSSVVLNLFNPIKYNRQQCISIVWFPVSYQIY